ncbi:hypothetical protein SCARD494_07383 [Seiridium cardinale]
MNPHAKMRDGRGYRPNMGARVYEPGTTYWTLAQETENMPNAAVAIPVERDMDERREAGKRTLTSLFTASRVSNSEAIRIPLSRTNQPYIEPEEWNL